MRKFLTVAGVGALAFLLSSCFTLQGFSIKVGALKPGKSTLIAVTVHPASSTPSREYQFVLIGVDEPTDLSAGNAIWGTNGNFGGPKPMVVAPGMYASVGTDCDGGSFTLSALGSLTWKGYVTQTKVRDKGLVAQSAVIQIGLKAKKAAASHDVVEVVGVTGVWGDTTGDGVSPDDTFACTGNGSGAVNII